ncbi:MAG: DUF2793 domain-containing protein [Gammaproteobacteria bacterium]|nr:DUF2793 domain-containing protein [Gammaproteobacteria bacterium]
MAGERILPGGAAIEGFWTSGSDAWDVKHDDNLRKLGAGLSSILIVQSQTTILPGSPTLGDIFIVQDGDANEKQIAVWDGAPASEVWNYYPAYEGLEAYPLDTKIGIKFDGTSWIIAAHGAFASSYCRLAGIQESHPAGANKVVTWTEVEDKDGYFGGGTVVDEQWVFPFNGRYRISGKIFFEHKVSFLTFQTVGRKNRGATTTFDNDFTDFREEGFYANAGVRRTIGLYGLVDVVAGDEMDILLFHLGTTRDLQAPETYLLIEYLGPTPV